MRTIAIGDIHGCSLALSVLLDQLQLARDDRVIFMGDYIDRGPNSRDVVEQVMQLALRCEVIPLLGNHELLILQSFASKQPNPFWVQQCGGAETLISYGGTLDDIPPGHWQFFKACRRHYETERHLFVHANYDPDKTLDEQPEHLLFWQHLSMFIPRPHVSGKTVVMGHTPQRTGDVLNLGHLICVDTGCFAGGWLTAFDVDSGQVWQANRFGEFRG